MCFKEEVKMENNQNYIEFCCPHCGKKIFMNIELKEHEEVYREKYNCSCGNSFKVEYDRIWVELNINTSMYLKDK
jgi:transcription elongation factor Elf1